RGQLREAEGFCREALALFVKLQATREAAWCQISLARVLHALSSSEKARELLEQACDTAHKLGDKRCEARCRELLAALS
ncbi:MAG TPA: tetratricopeptide repeat protein, partial [Myxococcaceae bacterium]